MIRCIECKNLNQKNLEPEYHFYGICKATKLLVLPSRIVPMPHTGGFFKCNYFLDRGQKDVRKL